MNQMRLKAKPLQISESEPFKEDALSRFESAQYLTEFISIVSEPLVLAIDSPFGTGKTTFLRMWLQHLKNQGFVSLHFNSWENDFSDSALVSLIGEVGAGLDALNLDGAESEIVRELFKKTKTAGAALVKAALPMAVKLATSGILDLDKAIESDIGRLAEDLAKKQIEKYQADKKTIQNFRRELEKLVKAIASRNQTSGKPVIFVIDELDRCRPLYAVELLEKIKHLFSVEGLVFVLAIDRKQLGESVRCLYGSGMDADGYLKRFIDFEYRLPVPDTSKFVESQFDRFNLNERLGQLPASDFNTLKPYLINLFEIFNFGLRTQEQCFTRISIALKTIPPKHYVLAPLLTFLICLRDVNRDLYFAYTKGQASPSEILEYLKQQKGAIAFVSGALGLTLEAYLIKGMPNRKERERLLDKLFEEAGRQPTGQPKSRITQLCTQIQFIEMDDINQYVVRRIEMAAKFIPLT